MKFIIDRTKWFRGKGSFASALLRSDGQRCCLGFFAQACNLTDNQIMNKTQPTNVGLIGKEEWDKVLLDSKENGHTHSQDAWDLIIINDSPITSDDNREKVITDTFAKHGIEVEFIG